MKWFILILFVLMLTACGKTMTEEPQESASIKTTATVEPTPVETDTSAEKTENLVEDPELTEDSELMDSEPDIDVSSIEDW